MVADLAAAALVEEADLVAEGECPAVEAPPEAGKEVDMICE